MRHLAMLREAHGLLVATLQRARSLPLPLQVGLQYERALILEERGRAKAAKEEFQKIYALMPEFKDVTLRVKLADAASGSHANPADLVRYLSPKGIPRPQTKT